MNDDLASNLTDREREVLGMLSERSEKIRRILLETKKKRVRTPSKSDVQRVVTPEERRFAIEHEVSRINNLIVSDWRGVTRGIHGPFPPLHMPGFELLTQHPFGTAGFGIGAELHDPATWIWGTTDGEDSRTLAYGVSNRFLCPYSTQWADESRPTQKFSIYPRTYISGWVYAVGEDDISFVTSNEATFSLGIKINLFQISPVGDPIVPIGGAPEEKWQVLHAENDSATVFLDYEYGYLSYVPMFQLHVPRANVFCDIEVTLEIRCKCGIGPVTARCGLLDEVWGNPLQDDRGRVEIWPAAFGIFGTDYD